MFERSIEQLQSERTGSQDIQRKVEFDSAGTRRVMAGDRIINGKRYAIEAEAVALVNGQGVVDADQQVSSAVLDRVQEMLHESLAAFARRGVETTSGDAKAGPGDQEYNGLIDCVITDQGNTDLPGYLLHLAGSLKREVNRAARVRGRLVFVITGQMIEADIEDASLASAE